MILKRCAGPRSVGSASATATRTGSRLSLAPQFKAIVEKAASAQKPDEKTTASFGAIAMRKQNCGPPMKWRADKAGPGVTADGDKVTHAAGAGQGCGLLDVPCSGAGCGVHPLPAQPPVR